MNRVGKLVVAAAAALVAVGLGAGTFFYMGALYGRARAFLEPEPGSTKARVLYFSSRDSHAMTEAFDDLKRQSCYSPDAESGPSLGPCAGFIEFIHAPMDGDEYKRRTADLFLAPAVAGIYFMDGGAVREFYPAGLEYLGPEKQVEELQKLRSLSRLPRENRLLEPANRLLSGASRWEHLARNLPALMVGLAGIGLMLAFVAGLTVSFSPCALPMYPALVGYIAGQDSSGARGFALSLLFVLGLCITLTGFGIAFTLIIRSGGHVIWGWFTSPWVYLALFLILGLLGLHLLGAFTIRFPSPVKMAPRYSGALGALGGGVLFGFVTNSCGAPITLALIIFAASSLSVFTAGAILFVYGIGQGFLLLLIGAFTAGMRGFVSGAGRWSRYVNYFSGGVLAAVALYFLYGFISML